MLVKFILLDQHWFMFQVDPKSYMLLVLPYRSVILISNLINIGYFHIILLFSTLVLSTIFFQMLANLHVVSLGAVLSQGMNSKKKHEVGKWSVWCPKCAFSFLIYSFVSCSTCIPLPTRLLRNHLRFSGSLSFFFLSRP